MPADNERPYGSSSYMMSPGEYDDEYDIPSPAHGATAGKVETKGKEKKAHATRRRVVQSCSECRRRKIKCDKKFPCGPCILRSDQSRCHEVGTAEKLATSANYASSTELADLKHRLNALEASLVKTGALIPSDLEFYLTGVRSRATDLASASAGQQSDRRGSRNDHDAPTRATSDTEDPVSDTEGAALTLEHLAFGRSRVDGSHSIPHFAARPPSSVSKPAPNNNYHLAKVTNLLGSSPTSSAMGTDLRSVVNRKSSLNLTDGKSYSEVVPGRGEAGYVENMTEEERLLRINALLDLLGPTDVFDLMYKKTDVAMVALTKVLPSRERGELLIKTYLEKVDWLHRCFHVPTLLSQCNDLWQLPRDQVMHQIAMPFIALYLVLCTLGLHFMDPDVVAANFTPEEVQNLPDLWYAASRSAQWAADFLGSHTIESLQTIILIGVLLNNKDRADAAWATLGAAIKMAQGLGLSRLGAEQQAVDGKPLPMWTGRWESVIQREIGRRLWWNLVYLDWSLAPSYNYSCSIQPDQIKTALPANIEDVDIIDGQPLKPQPLNVRTGMSFQLAKLKFAEITQRQIWQANNNNHPPYSFILSVDGELRKAMLELPAFFQPSPTCDGPTSREPEVLVAYYEKVTLNLAIHSRMLRLHRPWLSKGYHDERFSYSKEQCIRAARASLRLMSKDNGTASFLERWWIPLFYVTVSAMVVLIDLLRTARRDMQKPETEEKIAEVNGALDQMRRIADVSHPARAAIKVMDFLMAEVEDRRKPGSSLGKRKATGQPGEDNDDHGLQRAVKKLIHQAQLESDSPDGFVSPSPRDSPSGHRAHSAENPGSSTSSGGQQSNIRNPPDSSTRDRPVFDAYPMPPAIPTGPASSQMITDNGNMAPYNGYPQVDNRGEYQYPPQGGFPPQSPFTFPIDPSTATYPQFNNNNNNSMFSYGTQPSLDPAVESMLANYFPPPQTSNTGGMNNNQGGLLGAAGPASVAQVPDDFLSRVFSFSWEGNNAPGGNGNGGGGGVGNGSGISGVGENGQAGVGQSQNQGGDAAGQMGQGGMGGFAGFEGWSTHNWMA